MPHAIKLDALFREKDGKRETIQVIKGEPGPEGPAGSDATVTVENIKTALGNDALVQPSTGVIVGKYFRVASVDAEGSAVLEAVDLPIASGTDHGLSKFNASYGIQDASEYGYSGALKGVPVTMKASNSLVDAKTNNHRMIVPSNLDYAIRAGLISNSQITEPDFNAIRKTIGVDGLQKILSVTLEEEAVVSLTFDICYHDVITTVVVPAGATWSSSDIRIGNGSYGYIGSGSTGSSASPSTANTSIFIRTTLISGVWVSFYAAPVRTRWSTMYLQTMEKMNNTAEKYPYCSSFACGTMPAGTKIEIWGY